MSKGPVLVLFLIAKERKERDSERIWDDDRLAFSGTERKGEEREKGETAS